MEIGTIIRIKTNINNYPKRDGYKWINTYYKLNEGEFEILDKDENICIFHGKYFLCLGSEYFITKRDTPHGFELLSMGYEITTEVPNNLK